MNYTIPAEINSWTRLEAAKFYHSTLGWAVHPLNASDQGKDNERGKRPIFRGWPSHTAAEVTPEFLREHFANGSNHNIGVVVRAPFVHIDLDSKPDAGESVRAWLAMQPQLAGLPRERTGGGAHLSFICRDLPDSVARPKKAITMQVNSNVTAELYTDGMNLVVSPSVHKSGTNYSWEVTGNIPEVSWAQLKAWFGFEEPRPTKRGRPRKEPSWIVAYKGDVRTLKLKELFQSQAMLGRCLAPDIGKWSARCPWSEEHSDRGADWKPDATDTVIFADTKPPGFKCLHGHCAERGLEHVCKWFEQRNPGCVDEHCTEMRVWTGSVPAPDGRARVILPEVGRPDSEFADEIGKHIGGRKVWFNKGGAVVSVETKRLTEKVTAQVFNQVSAVEACTAVEQFVQTGVVRTDKESDDRVFLPHTMSRECAGKLIASPQFRARLPEIIRILPIRLPIHLEGGIVFPEPGYDRRFSTYLDPKAPEICEVPFDRAIELLTELHADFGWKDAQSLVHALARLITPYCRGLMGWHARFPFWHFCGNRPRAGKDYLAGVTQLLYEGHTCEDAPLERESEETRKRITAALTSGRRTMHFANCQGYIQDAVLTQAITSSIFAARNLGSTDARADLKLPNEIEFSMSANVGLTFREDIEPRTRKISLCFYEENPNGRKFSKPDLHGWVLQHRSELLGAVDALVRRWKERGCPDGPTPFNSFPEWGNVVGGIMHTAGLGDPCLPHADQDDIGGDRSERAMRAVYKYAFAKHPGAWIPKGDLFSLLTEIDDEDLSFFGSFEEAQFTQTKKRIGLALKKFHRRELGGVVLEVDASGKGSQQQVRFSAVGGDGSPAQPDQRHPIGNLGNLGKVASGNAATIDNFEKKADREFKNATATIADRVSEVSEVSMIQGLTAFPEIASAIESAGSVALDIETYGPGKKDGLNPWRGDIRLLSLKIAGRDPWVIDLRATGYDLGPLAAALEAVMVIGHNLKFDALWLAVKCGIRLRKVFCTLTAARLLSAGTKPGNDLNKCLEHYLGIKPDADQSTSDWAAKFLTAEQLAYAARDVAHLHALQDVLVAELGQAGLKNVSMLEMELLPVVVAMEQTGIAVNRRDLERIERESKQKQTAIAAQLSEALSVPDLNPNSTDQLQSALNKAGVKVPNTSAEALKGSGDTCYVPLILEYKAAKSQAQQAASLIECIAPDGRIHGRFEPTGTATGRFSSKEPNLQNIGRGALRACFVAPAGSKLVVADYSQIELRAAAAIAGETKMIEAYRRGEDLHRGTAAAVLGKAPDKVTKEDRQLAKAVNFGLLYGQYPRGLVKYAASTYGVTLSEAEAKAIRSRFFGTYVKLRQWHERSRRTADNGVGEVRTALGRRRLIPHSASEWERFTALVNTPVQGGCADGMKKALVQLAAKLPPSSRIVSTVHDEIIVEAPDAEAEEVLQLVKTVMVESMATLYPQVPIEVEAHVCANWGQK
jgi:DNA polymerase-1